LLFQSTKTHHIHDYYKCQPVYDVCAEVYFTGYVDFTWREYDCEELVGVTNRIWWGWSCSYQKTLKAYPKLSQHDRRVSVPL